MAQEVTNCVITDLLDISNIYFYLCQNWHLQQLRVDIIFDHNGEQMTLSERVLNPERIKAIYKFMIDRWANGKLRIVITTTDGP